jgi:hypothetical protein
VSIVERGQAERERVAREERWRDTNRRTTAWWFRFVFLTRHDPEPELEGWRVIGPGDTYAPSEFTVEGILYRVRWEFEGAGGDRAHWDNGWWPQWSVVVRRPRRWLPFLQHEVEVGVWGAQAVAAAVEWDRRQPTPSLGSRS